MASDSTSTPPSMDKSSAAYLKRREQVRRAQRTHRERKETYIHALEAEVLVLRTKARSVEEQNDALSAEVAQLRSQLDAQQSTNNVAWDEAWFKDLDVVSTGASGCVNAPGLSEPVDESNVAGSALVRRDSKSNSWSTSAVDADMAMEFVLALEKPCIQYAQSLVFEPLNPYPSNQSPVSTELAKYHSFAEDQLAAPQSYTSEDVASSLDNLLSLSSQFCLENEVTPIQAWQHLRRYLEFGVVDTKGVRALMEALLEHVRCYGFGAVISRSVLDAICSSIFTMGN